MRVCVSCHDLAKQEIVNEWLQQTVWCHHSVLLIQNDKQKGWEVTTGHRYKDSETLKHLHIHKHIFKKGENFLLRITLLWIYVE